MTAATPGSATREPPGAALLQKKDASDPPRAFDYVTVGHVTVDELAGDGSRRAGGSALYSALQAARLGLRALILTRGVPAEVEELLAPYGGELEFRVLPAARTTTLRTRGAGLHRRQRLLAWAGPIDGPIEVDTAILHLAPVARETPREWRGRADFVGLTPQGLLRQWDAAGEIALAPPPPRPLPARCDALVLSAAERERCAELLRGARASGALVAVTAGALPTELHLPGGELLRVPVPPLQAPADDLGAGDVFAAALFVALREGRPPGEAAAFATAAAAVRIAGAGPGAIGGRAAIEARLESA
jgi:sugar/nucleoside kinase (ribokinase family)